MNPTLRRLWLKIWYSDYAIPALLIVPLTFLLIFFKFFLLGKVAGAFGGVWGYVLHRLAPPRQMLDFSLQDQSILIRYQYLFVGNYVQEILREDYSCIDIIDDIQYRPDEVKIFRVHLEDGFKLNFKFNDYVTKQAIDKTLTQAGFTQKKFYAPDLIEYTPPKQG
jgi:hypothetical protein